MRTESHTRLDDDRKLRACFQHVQSLVRTVPQLVGIGRIGLRLAEAQTDRRRVSIGGLTNAVAADRALNSNELSNAITSNARVVSNFAHLQLNDGVEAPCSRSAPDSSAECSLDSD